MSQSREQKEYLSLSYDLAQFHKLIEFIIKIILLVFLYLFLCPLPLCISLGQKPLFVYHSSTPDSRLRLLYIDDCLMMMESKNQSYLRICVVVVGNRLKQVQSQSTMHNGPAVNQKLLKIEQAQTNLKWSILSYDFQKYLS